MQSVSRSRISGAAHNIFTLRAKSIDAKGKNSDKKNSFHEIEPGFQGLTWPGRGVCSRATFAWSDQFLRAAIVS
jgi:hypothetical protein